jgi:hypothetical protein
MSIETFWAELMGSTGIVMERPATAGSWRVFRPQNFAIRNTPWQGLQRAKYNVFFWKSVSYDETIPQPRGCGALAPSEIVAI